MISHESVRITSAVSRINCSLRASSDEIRDGLPPRTAPPAPAAAASAVLSVPDDQRGVLAPRAVVAAHPLVTTAQVDFESIISHISFVPGGFNLVT